MKIYQFNVRFGIHKLEIFFKNSVTNLCCKQFIVYTLAKIASKNNLKLMSDEDPHTLGLFEDINGIEQLINEDMNIFEMKNFVEHRIKEVSSQEIVVLISKPLVIRKKNFVENMQRKELSSSVKAKIRSFYMSRKGSNTENKNYSASLKVGKRHGVIRKPKYLLVRIKLDQSRI